MKLQLFSCVCGYVAELRISAVSNVVYLYCSHCGNIEQLLGVPDTPARLRDFPIEHAEQFKRMVKRRGEK